MKAVVAAFNQEKALVGAFSVITNLRMEFFQALVLYHQIVVPDVPVCVRSGQRVEVPLHGVRERGRRLPHPLHLRADAGGQTALLHGARPRPVQQRRSEDVILYLTTFIVQFRWVGAGHWTAWTDG